MQVIQADFVERRQASHGGEGMSQDDLLFRLGAARYVLSPSLSSTSSSFANERAHVRQALEAVLTSPRPVPLAHSLLALSYGETTLSKEAWQRMAELDDRRKERMPVVPKQE